VSHTFLSPNIADMVKTYLPAPAETNNRPLLNAPGLAQLLYDLGDARQRLGRRGLCLEELAQLLALLFVVARRVP
jgi:hypothetical protein